MFTANMSMVEITFKSNELNIKIPINHRVLQINSSTPTTKPGVHCIMQLNTSVYPTLNYKHLQHIANMWMKRKHVIHQNLKHPVYSCKHSFQQWSSFSVTKNHRVLHIMLIIKYLHQSIQWEGNIIHYIK